MAMASMFELQGVMSGLSVMQSVRASLRGVAGPRRDLEGRRSEGDHSQRALFARAEAGTRTHL